MKYAFIWLGILLILSILCIASTPYFIYQSNNWCKNIGYDYAKNPGSFKKDIICMKEIITEDNDLVIKYKKLDINSRKHKTTIHKIRCS